MAHPDAIRVAVVGAGIVGLATARALTEQGAAVRVYERGEPGNGQSGGQSRVFRHAHDDPRLVAMAAEALGIWRSWEEAFGIELVSRDGAVALGPGVPDKLETLQRVAGISARPIEAGELAERQPLLAPYDGPAMLDEGGGAIRTRAAIGAMANALIETGSLVTDEVISLREIPGGRIEIRSGGETATFDHAVVCAGRDTSVLARTVGLALPVRDSAHVRLTFAVRDKPPHQLACLQDSSDVWGETGIYAAAAPGNEAYAVGLSETTDTDREGSLLDPAALAALADRASAYVAKALPGLDPDPIDVRHCWVTELPWSPDGVAAWEAGNITFLAGHNLFKQAPALGRALAARALGEPVRPELRPDARLGASE